MELKYVSHINVDVHMVIYQSILIDAYEILVCWNSCLNDMMMKCFFSRQDPISPDMPVTNSIDNDPPGYGSACSRNNECQQATNHLRCFQEKCTCFDGYVPLGKYLCYNLRGQSNSFERINSITGMNFQVHNLLKVPRLYLLQSLQHQQDDFSGMKWWNLWAKSVIVVRMIIFVDELYYNLIVTMVNVLVSMGIDPLINTRVWKVMIDSISFRINFDTNSHWN